MFIFFYVSLTNKRKKQRFFDGNSEWVWKMTVTQEDTMPAIDFDEMAWEWSGRASEREREKKEKTNDLQKTDDLHKSHCHEKHTHFYVRAFCARTPHPRSAHFVHVYTFPIIIYEDQTTEERKKHKNSTRRNDETNDERKRKKEPMLKRRFQRVWEQNKKKPIASSSSSFVDSDSGQISCQPSRSLHRKTTTPLQPINFFRLLNNNKNRSHTDIQRTTQLFLFMVRSKISFVLFFSCHSSSSSLHLFLGP